MRPVAKEKEGGKLPSDTKQTEEGAGHPQALREEELKRVSVPQEKEKGKKETVKAKFGNEKNKKGGRQVWKEG